MAAVTPATFLLHLQVRFAAILDLLEVLPEPGQNFLSGGITILGFKFQFVERKVDDVVMVEFLRGDLAAQVKPDGVQQLDFLRSQMRRMRAEVADVLLAARR